MSNCAHYEQCRLEKMSDLVLTGQIQQCCIAHPLSALPCLKELLSELKDAHIATPFVPDVAVTQ